MRVLLTTADAGRRLGVTPATVRLMARRGDLRVAVQTPTGLRLFDANDVEEECRRRSLAGNPRNQIDALNEKRPG